MTADLAALGTPDWLPLSVRRAQAAEEQREAQEARAALREREDRAETRRNEDLALYRSQAEARGEVVSAVALASGQVPGRGLAEIFADAAAMADVADAREAAARRREEGGPINYVMPTTPVSRSAPRSPEDREIENLLRRYQAEHGDTGTIDRARFASEARKALRRDKPVI